jgi:WD40 repeat protein
MEHYHMATSKSSGFPLAAALALGMLGSVLGHAKEQKTEPNAGQTALSDAPESPLPKGAVLRLGSLRLNQGAPVTSIAWLGDGKRLISGSAPPDEGIRVWDAFTGNEMRQLLKSRQGVRRLALSSDGKVAGATDLGGAILIWEPATGKVLLRDNDDAFQSVALAADGKSFAVIKGRGVACLIEISTAKTLQTFGTDAYQLDLSPDGKTLATASRQGGLHLWDVAKGKLLHSLGQTKQTNRVQSLRFAPDGKVLATGGQDKLIHLWDTTTGKEVGLLKGHLSIISDLSWSPDGETLASSSVDGTVRLWDVAKNQERLRFTGHQGQVLSVAFAPDGKRVASGGVDNRVRIWDAETGKEVVTHDGHSGFVASLALLQNNNALLTAAEDATIRLWDLTSGKCTGQFPAPHTRPKTVAVAPDGKLMATGTEDGSVQLFELPAGKLLRTWPAHRGAVLSVAFSPDGKTLVSSCRNVMSKTILWDVATGDQVQQLKSAAEQMFALAFSPDGKLLCTGSGKGILRVWDVATGTEIGRLPGHNSLIERIVFAPDGKLVVSVSHDGTARVWNLAAGKQVRLVDDLEAGYAVALSADGRTVATGEGRGVRLWEVATGKLRATIEGHRGPVASLQFLPGGRTLLSGSQDTTVLAWDLSARAKAGVAAEDSAAEWKHLQGDDVQRSYRALWTLAARPKDALAKLQKELEPVAKVDPKMMDQWIADLNDKKFDVRQKAMAELKKAGEPAWLALQKVLDKQQTLELETRVRQLLGDQDDPVPLPDRLRLMRALELLELIDSPATRDLLQRLANGAPGAWLTTEAQMILARLKARS